MDEKVLVQSSHYNVKKISAIMAIIGAILSAIILIATYSTNRSNHIGMYNTEWKPGQHRCGCTITFWPGDEYGTYESNFYEVHPSLESYLGCVSDEMLDAVEIIVGCIPLALFVIFAAFFYLWTNRDQLTVTDKRVYGTAAFGKRVDLPLDSISAVGTSWLKGIDVGTSSGRISFKLIKNQDHIHSIMSKLLMERQKETKNAVVENLTSTSNADELKKFKDLLDSGIITQEEFDSKKKQLLGL